MDKRFFVSAAVVFVLSMAFGFTVHGLFLAPDYAQLPSLFRSEADQQSHFPFMLLAHAITSLALVWVYGKGKEGAPPLGQGLRFGLAVAALVVAPKFLIYYAVQPMPGLVVAKQIVLDTVAVTLMGVAVAFLNK